MSTYLTGWTFVKRVDITLLRILNILHAMASTPSHGFSSASDFRGNFAGYIEQVQRELETLHGDDAGEFENVVERSQSEAPLVAARNWLEERWGHRYPCPVCGNILWTISEVAPSMQPGGFLSFSITCGFCGNTLHVVPGQALQDSPVLQQPAQESLFDETDPRTVDP